MGDAFCCDRCGGVKKGHPALTVWTGEPDYKPGKIGRELCGTCNFDFEEFMENPEPTEKSLQ